MSINAIMNNIITIENINLKAISIFAINTTPSIDTQNIIRINEKTLNKNIFV